MRYHSLDEVLADLDSGMLVTVMIPDALMDFIDEGNVEEVIAKLPAKHRPFVLEWAHGAIYSQASERINLAGITNLGPVRSEDLQHPREAVTFAAFRSWFERHRWPDEGPVGTSASGR